MKSNIVLHVVCFVIILVAYSHLDHLYKVQAIHNAINQVHSGMIDTETAQRGYMISQDLQYVADYNLSYKILLKRFEILCDLLPKNPTNQEICKDLGGLVRKKLSEMDSIMILEKQGHTKDALTIFKTNDGLKYRTSIDKILTHIKVDSNSSNMSGCIF